MSSSINNNNNNSIITNKNNDIDEVIENSQSAVSTPISTCIGDRKSFNAPLKNTDLHHLLVDSTTPSSDASLSTSPSLATSGGGGNSNLAADRPVSPSVKLLGKVFDTTADKHIQQQNKLNRCSPPPLTKPNFIIAKKEKHWMSYSTSSIPTTPPSAEIPTAPFPTTASTTQANTLKSSNDRQQQVLSRSKDENLNNNENNINSPGSSPNTSSTNIVKQTQQQQQQQQGWVSSPTTSPNTISPLPSPPTTRIRNNHRLSGRVISASTNEECNTTVSNNNNLNSSNIVLEIVNNSSNDVQTLTPLNIENNNNNNNNINNNDNDGSNNNNNNNNNNDQTNVPNMDEQRIEKSVGLSQFLNKRNYQARRVAGDWKDKQMFTQGTTVNLVSKERKNLIGSRDPLLSPKEFICINSNNNNTNNSNNNNNNNNSEIDNNCKCINDSNIDVNSNNNNSNDINSNNDNNSNSNNNNDETTNQVSGTSATGEDDAAVQNLVNRYRTRRDNASRKSKLSTQDVEWITTKFYENNNTKESSTNTPEKKALLLQQQQQPPQSKASPLLKNKYLGGSGNSGNNSSGVVANNISSSSNSSSGNTTNKISGGGGGGFSISSNNKKRTNKNNNNSNNNNNSTVDSSGDEEEDTEQSSNPNSAPCYRYLEDVAKRRNIPSEPSRKPGLKSPLFLHVPTLAQPTQFHQNAPEKLNSTSLSISVEENSHQDQSLLFNQQIINRVAHDKDLTYLFFPVLKSSTKIVTPPSINSHHHNHHNVKSTNIINAAAANKQPSTNNNNNNIINNNNNSSSNSRTANGNTAGNNNNNNNNSGSSSSSSSSSGVNISSSDSYISLSLSPSLSPCSSLTPSQASPPSSASSPIESLSSLPLSPPNSIGSQTSSSNTVTTPRGHDQQQQQRKSIWSPKPNNNNNNKLSPINNSPQSDTTMSPSLSPSSPQEYLQSPTPPMTLSLSDSNNTELQLQQQQQVVVDSQTYNPIEEEFKSRSDIYFVSQPPPIKKFVKIKCGSLDALVEVLTHHKLSDPNFVDTFLLTHKTFTTSQTLLSKLIERYEEEPTALDEENEEQIEKQSKIYRSIKLRVCSILKIWIDKHFYDFEKNPQLLKDFEHFIKVTLVEDGMEKISQNIQRNIARKLNGETFDNTLLMNRVPAPIIPTLKQDQIVTLFSLDDLEIARQLTLIEHEAYSLIKPNECVNLAFSKLGKEENAPNITGIIRRSNIIPLWVATEIVQEERLTKRANIIKSLLILLMYHCRNLNNFNGVMEILSGLNITPVFRLKKTWETIPRKYLATFRHLNSLMAPKHNFKVYRDVLHTKNPPCLPFLGVYLTDLTFLEEGSPDTLEGGLINMVKRTQLAAVIQEIQQFQQLPYSLSTVPIIRDFLHQVNGLQERALYKQSRIVEP
ncbi:RasGEF domain-containing protein [Heterostelium album PN500]|uniref:RasGEF domain-containing protein n=1 Tax=Heterostelium pallidum (strain ATCC 26659 / Pp 5 / PN500) TaxID=670386 RepID=D3B2R8_HETP5|nr:RasGEF domain-containing protein [Heterostelium album PN500]EFA83616.1 RasGEF domain-containing protein [Heterostelium album PN500]|eukprot:XP_020435733.1 RasGEF domain-containing protein [Heterostelium album PN500]